MINNKLIAGILILGILLIGGYLWYNTGPVVSSQGYASLKAQADEVSIYLNLQAIAQTAEDAKNQYNSISDKVINSLNALGYGKEKIELSNYNIYPNYDWSNGTQKITGYTANSMIIIKIDNFNKVAEIIDKTVDAGALVSAINFELSTKKQNEYKAQALKEASQDSKIKADSVASGLGKKVGRLVSVSSQEFNYPGPIVYYAGSAEKGSVASARQAAAGISPRELEVSASVSAQYKLRAF
jgi:uncharacterized protein YggE